VAAAFGGRGDLPGMGSGIGPRRNRNHLMLVVAPQAAHPPFPATKFDFGLSQKLLRRGRFDGTDRHNVSFSAGASNP
jgi:hypothetical protein